MNYSSKVNCKLHSAAPCKLLLLIDQFIFCYRYTKWII